MTTTDRAIGELWYRLVYELKLKTVADVPEQYREILELIRREHEKP